MGVDLGKPIGERVTSFDFKQIDTKGNKDDYLHVGLAPSYGKLTSDMIKKMDDNLKIMIIGVVKSIGKLPSEQRTWDNVLSAMLNCSVIEADGQQGIYKTDRLIKESANSWKFDGSPDAQIVQEVKVWFNKLIGNQDVLDSCCINIQVLAEIVAQTGATVDSFASFFHKVEEHSKEVVDIGVLRFPDPDHPFFQLYRIQLTAYSKSDRTLASQIDRNGIIGVYNSRNFKPRASVIAGISADALKAGINQANDLLSS